MASTPPSVRTAPAKPVAVLYSASGLGPRNGPPQRSDRPGGARGGPLLRGRLGGPEMAPIPQSCDRPGGAVAVLYSAAGLGAPKWPHAPSVPTAPAGPWRSSIPRQAWGRRNGPHTLQRSDRPGGGGTALVTELSRFGARTWPPTPSVRSGPGGAGMVLYDRVESFWGPDMAPLRSERPGGTGAVLDHRGSRFHRFKTNGDAGSVMKACGIGSPSMPISRASTSRERCAC